MRPDSSGQSVLLLLDVIEVLKRERVPYAVVGAMAVSYYGIVRATLDTDAIIALPDQMDALVRLKKLLEDAGLKAIYRRADAVDPLLGMVIVEDHLGNQVDLILGIRGLDAGVYTRVRSITFRGAPIDMIGPEDLIAMKVFAGSAKDIDDVKGILKVSGETIDAHLLQTLSAGYGKRAQRTLKSLLQ